MARKFIDTLSTSTNVQLDAQCTVHSHIQSTRFCTRNVQSATMRPNMWTKRAKKKKWNSFLFAYCISYHRYRYQWDPHSLWHSIIISISMHKQKSRPSLSYNNKFNCKRKQQRDSNINTQSVRSNSQQVVLYHVLGFRESWPPPRTRIAKPWGPLILLQGDDCAWMHSTERLLPTNISLVPCRAQSESRYSQGECRSRNVWSYLVYCRLLVLLDIK